MSNTPPPIEDHTGKVEPLQEENCSQIDWSKWRNLIGFWIFGLCNNYSYVIMLSAAHDILKGQEGNKTSNGTVLTTTPNPTSEPHRDLDCTKIGTGAILLADIIPCLIIKLLAPLFIQKIHFHVKIVFCVACAVVSFIIVGLSKTVVMSIIGVVFASISSGFGEITFLSMTAYFHKNVVSTWSSGTGAAGVVGALSYAGLTEIVKPSTALFIVIFVPLLNGITYFFILDRPEGLKTNECCEADNTERDLLIDADSVIEEKQEDPSFSMKMKLLVALLYLIIPLTLVYFFEYMINQAFFELMFFPTAFISHDQQYRWYQVIYQVGVFASRSSVNLFKFRPTWVLAILQGINMVFFLMQVLYPFVPSIWIVFVLILYEGLLGGLAYVNSFYRITVESDPQHKEFNMAAASFGDALGIALAGFTSVPVHKAICDALS